MIPQRLNFLCRRFGILYLFHLYSGVIRKDPPVYTTTGSAYCDLMRTNCTLGRPKGVPQIEIL